MHVAVPFHWGPTTGIDLKARVDVAADGSGVIRGKAWKKGDPEPEPGPAKCPLPTRNDSGCPGLFGFSPQNMRVYIDNIAVTAN